MKMSNSSNKIRENINIKTPEQNNLKQFVKKRISLQDDFIKEKIYYKLNEGTILYFIRSSNKNVISNRKSLEINSSEMIYDLNMINKYEEESDSNLSFISEFDLEEENKNNDSFESSLDENSVEEIDIVNK